MGKRQIRNPNQPKIPPKGFSASEKKRGTWWEKHWEGVIGLFTTLSLTKIADWFVIGVLERGNGVAMPVDPKNFFPWVALLLSGALLSRLLQGITWRLFEKKKGTDYGPGGAKQPMGIDGIFFGMTITVPLMVAPYLMFRVCGIPAIPAHHYPAWFFTMLLATLAFVAIYGLSDRTFPGIRRLVLSNSFLGASRSKLEKLQIKEGIILFAYISLISLLTIAPYRLMAGLSRFDALLALRLICAISFPFFLSLAYIWFFDRKAVGTTSGGNRRGLLVGTLLMMSLYLALYA